MRRPTICWIVSVEMEITPTKEIGISFLTTKNWRFQNKIIPRLLIWKEWWLARMESKIAKGNKNMRLFRGELSILEQGHPHAKILRIFTMKLMSTTQWCEFSMETSIKLLSMDWRSPMDSPQYTAQQEHSVTLISVWLTVLLLLRNKSERGKETVYWVVKLALRSRKESVLQGTMSQELSINKTVRQTLPNTNSAASVHKLIPTRITGQNVMHGILRKTNVFSNALLKQ